MKSRFIAQLRILLFTGLLLPSAVSRASGQGLSPNEPEFTPFLTLDTYRSFIGRKGADVWGFRAGVEWKGKWRFGAGYNKVSSDIVEWKTLEGKDRELAGKDSTKAQLFFRFYPLSAEYVAYRRDPWQIGIPVLLGYGTSYFEYFDKNNERQPLFRKGVVALQPGCNVQYKVLKWLGVSAGIGYRLMLINNPSIDAQLDSPVLSLGFRLFPGEIYRSIKREKD
jgi:hypothetical protein